MPSAHVRIQQRQAIEGKPRVEDPIADYTTPLDAPAVPELTPQQKERQNRRKLREQQERLTEAWEDMEDMVEDDFLEDDEGAGESLVEGVHEDRPRKQRLPIKETSNVEKGGGQQDGWMNRMQLYVEKEGKEDNYKLDLSEQNANNDCLPALAATTRKAVVRTLDLRKNVLDDEGCEELATLLELDEHIQHVILCSNRIGGHGAATLGNAVRYNKNIKEWDLSGNFIGDIGADGFLQGLMLNRTVVTLILRRTALGDAACSALQLALRGNSVLTELDISSNMFSQQGVRTITKYLRHPSCRLSFLDLRENRLGDQGAAFLALGLGSTSCLKTLFVSKCSIGDAGAATLAPALCIPTIETIDLSSNVFGDAGAEALAKIVTTPPKLLALDLRGNTIGQAGRDCFVVAARGFKKRPDEPPRKVAIYIAAGVVVKWEGQYEQSLSLGAEDQPARIIDGETVQITRETKRMCDASVQRMCGGPSLPCTPQ